MRVTEQDNPLTARLDRVPVAEQLALICAAEAEVFGSPAWGPGLRDAATRTALEALAARVRACLQAGGTLLLAGAGTSGRLALAAQALHRADGLPGRVTGLLAGGVAAFYRAREGVEDSAQTGAADVAAAAGQGGAAVYLGISCGLSAAYVAGGMQACLDRGDHVAVLGFNPPADADTRPLPGNPGGFRALVAGLTAHSRGTVLTPVVGPEPVTGSTRMKGGSATKILLDALTDPDGPSGYLDAAADLYGLLAASAADLVPVVTAAADALTAGAGITYVADARTGLTALIDASECPPTFGATPHQVRCLVPDAFAALVPGFALDAHRLALLPHHAADGGQVLLLGDQPTPAGGVQAPQDALVVRLPAAVTALLARQTPYRRARLGDLAWKRVLNLISTAAFVGAGKVYGNRMIDLRISNLKLWDRARRIVAALADIDTEAAEAWLRRTVPGAEAADADPAARVRLAAALPRVVPTAVLAARRGMAPAAAARLLAASPKLRDALGPEKP